MFQVIRWFYSSRSVSSSVFLSSIIFTYNRFVSLPYWPFIFRFYTQVLKFSTCVAFLYTNSLTRSKARNFPWNVTLTRETQSHMTKTVFPCVCYTCRITGLYIQSPFMFCKNFVCWFVLCSSGLKRRESRRRKRERKDANCHSNIILYRDTHAQLKDSLNYKGLMESLACLCSCVSVSVFPCM